MPFLPWNRVGARTKREIPVKKVIVATPINDWAEASPQLEVLARAIEMDLVPILSFPEGAPHTIAREWACYVDHLGALYTGKTNQSQERFRTYLQEVLSEVDAGYREQAGILLHMFRHGTIHEFDPKVLVNPSGQRLGWVVSNSPGRDQSIILEDGRSFLASHLRITAHLDLIGQFALFVSTRCLVEDLLSSIDVFKTGMGNVPKRIDSWNKAASELVKPTPFAFNVLQSTH